MDDLEAQDMRNLIAPVDWFGLGDRVEAMAELDNVTASMRSHPDVLQVRCRIYERVYDWAACVDIASAMVKLAPENSFGWIRRSFALHELKRTKEALECLLPALDLFPEETVIRYNLACYHCVLGNMGETAPDGSFQPRQQSRTP